MTDRIDPETMVHWLERRIWSAETWLETFGNGKRKRPDTEIEQKQFDVRALNEIKFAYEKAWKRSKEND